MNARVQVVTPHKVTRSRENIPAVYDVVDGRAYNKPMKPEELTPIQMVAVDALNALLVTMSDVLHDKILGALREMKDIEHDHEFPRRVMVALIDDYQQFSSHLFAVRKAFDEEFKFILKPYLYAQHESVQIAKRVRSEMAGVS